MLHPSPAPFCCFSLALLLIAACNKSDASSKTGLAAPSSISSAASRPTTSARVSALPAADFLPSLKAYVADLPAGFDAISQERKRPLDKLALFIKTRRDSGETARVVYICTHNSRRSHMGQLFATLAAAYYGVDRVALFSGGTEVTELNPRAVVAFERAGFAVKNPGGDNPRYQIQFARNRPVVEAFSKRYDDASNPKDGFAAVMTCSHADTNCPIVAGASLRVALHYEDPKVSDDTPEEAAAYDTRARQIATEAFYVFSRVKG